MRPEHVIVDNFGNESRYINTGVRLARNVQPVGKVLGELGIEVGKGMVPFIPC